MLRSQTGTIGVARIATHTHTSFLCVLQIQRIKQQTSPLEQFAAISKTVWLTSLSAISCVSCKQVTTNICCCASFCGPVPARHTKSFPLFRNHYFNITGLLLCCKIFFLNFVLLWGPPFCGGPCSAEHAEHA